MTIRVNEPSLGDIMKMFDPEGKYVDVLTRLGNVLHKQRNAEGDAWLEIKFDEIYAYMDSHASSNPPKGNEMPGIIKAYVAEQEAILAAIKAEETSTSVGDQSEVINMSESDKPITSVLVRLMEGQFSRKDIMLQGMHQLSNC